ncbi:unnamed protein product [Lathyrus sativus]|nr:unnamed protein product [Lathyrus sativus]
MGPSSRLASEEEHISASASTTQPTGFPGGLYDMSLLVKYEQYIARHVWFCEETGLKKELKVAGHGLKLTLRVSQQLPKDMEGWISKSSISSLPRTSLTKINTNLVSAFVER